MRRCRTCRDVLPIEDFGLDEQDPVGYSWICPSCAPAPDPAPKRSWRRRADLVEDVEFLASQGESLPAILLRTGTNPEQLEIALRREGRTDLQRELHISGRARSYRNAKRRQAS
jgi:hypothetical protein